MPVLQTVGTYFRNLANAVTGRSVPLGVTAGSIGFSAGGPLFLDAFHSKRPPAPYELVNSYKAIAYSCIRLNQHGVARTPLKLYAKTSRKQSRPRRSCSRVASVRTERYIRSQPYLARNLEPDDAVDEIKEHPFLDAMEHPNPYFDYDLLIQHIVASMDVVGTAYFYPTRPLGPDGNPDITQARAGMEIWPFQSQYVYPYKGMGLDNLIKEYRYFGDSYPQDGLVRIRYVSLRDPYLSAYSPLHACFEQAGLTDYYYAIVESILKVGARPSAMVFPKDANIPLGEPERKRIEMDLNNRFTGGRSGHIWVSNGALDIKELQFPPSDLAGLKITENMRLLVANCFDVPISLLQAEDTNRAVASEGTHQHQYYAIEPRCRAIATALTKQLAQPVDDRLFFCFDNPVARDDEREAKIWSMKLADGRATANEAREDEGLEPVEWGDEPWLAGTLKQPSQIEEAHDLGLKQQQEAHEVGLEQQKDGLKTSDQTREHADERLKMDKEAAQKDSEDRAREANDKERSFVQRDREITHNERLLDIAQSRSDNEIKIVQINADTEVAREKIRSAAEMAQYHEKIKALRSSNDDLMEIARDKTIIEERQARIEGRTFGEVNDLMGILRRDLLSCNYTDSSLRFNPNHDPHDGRFSSGSGSGASGDEKDEGASVKDSIPIHDGPPPKVNPKLRNEELDNFLEEHPNAKIETIKIEGALKKKIEDRLEYWKSVETKEYEKAVEISKLKEIPPPIVQYYSSGNVGVPDGFHRITAYHLLGKTEIEGYIIRPKGK